LTTWERLAGVIVRWYVLAIVLYAAVWVIWVLSGGNAYNTVTNLIVGLSGLIVIIVILEVLKRRVK